MTTTWKDVWAARRIDSAIPSTLARLMAVDGLDTAFGSVGEAAWSALVDRCAGVLGLSRGISVFEVGCGAGAFLYRLWERGCLVGGLDQSAALIEYGREAMPGADLSVGEAQSLPATPRADVVVSCGVFMYFPSLDYAASVVQRMSAKAVRAIAILDIPDKAREADAMRARKAALGDAEYASRYRGLEHLYFDKDWMSRAVAAEGFADVRVEDQRVDGYTNASYRFNVFAFRA